MDLLPANREALALRYPDLLSLMGTGYFQLDDSIVFESARSGDLTAKISLGACLRNVIEAKILQSSPTKSGQEEGATRFLNRVERGQISSISQGNSEPIAQESGGIWVAQTVLQPITHFVGRLLGDHIVYVHSKFDPLREASESLREDFVMKPGSRILCFGFGLGYHIRAIAERVGPTGRVYVFIIDPALFASVLTKTDISALLASENVDLIWSIDEMEKIYDHVFVDGSILDDGIFFLEPLVKAAVERSYALKLIGRAKNSYTGYHENNLTLGYFDKLKYINANIVANLTATIGFPGLARFAGTLKGTTAVIVGAGPSLDVDIDNLGRMRGRSIVICVPPALAKLLDAGIVPDFVVAIDFWQDTIRFFDKWNDKTVLVVKPSFAKAVIEKIAPRYIVNVAGRYDGLTEIDPFFEQWGVIGGPATVYNTAFHLALTLGCDRIVSLGRDFAFPRGKDHCDGYALDFDFTGQITFPEVALDGDTIMTHGLFDENIRYVARFLPSVRESVCYNACATGAVIRGEIIVGSKSLLDSVFRDGAETRAKIDKMKRDIVSFRIDETLRGTLIDKVSSRLVR